MNKQELENEEVRQEEKKTKVASTHIAGEITVTGNKYVVGVRNMLSPADFGPKLLEVIKAHFPQDVK